MANDLPQSIKNRILQCGLAYESGNSISVVEQGSRLLQLLNEEQLKLANDFLKLKNAPTLPEMLVEARIDLSRSDVDNKLPAPSNKEVLFLAEVVKEQGDELITQWQSHAAGFGEVSSPKDYSEYESLFWDMHVFRNRFTNEVSTSNSSAELIANRGRRLESVKVSDERRKIIEFDFLGRVAQLNRILQDLEEREAFLRIFRLQDTISLIGVANSEKEKFTFAYNMESDVTFLEDFFKRYSGVEMTREDLNDDSLLQEISAEALGIREKYADKIHKGKLLFIGLHWWFRGRYGAGPMANGLLKAPNAHMNEEMLFPLAMPTATPAPNDPYEADYRVPHYERRHHYTWQVQQESVTRYQRPPYRQSKHEKVDTPEGAPKYTRFY